MSGMFDDWERNATTVWSSNGSYVNGRHSDSGEIHTCILVTIFFVKHPILTVPGGEHRWLARQNMSQLF